MHKSALLLLAIILVPGVLAEGFATTLIHGYVYTSDGSGIPGYPVRIVCGLDENNVPPPGSPDEQFDITDEHGKFFSIFQEYDCSIGGYAHACVGPEGQETCSSKQVNDVISELEIQVEKLEITIPEFSTMAAAVAASSAGLLFMYLRRR